ncbi:MAG: alpha/beta hydrolase [Bacteroidales bacterium]|nr:alpha/beta hydrolase [Bacteroidales bacterium]
MNYKNFLPMLAASLFVLACAPVPETYTKNVTVEDGGTGPYTAIMVEEPSLEAHTIFRPADLSKFGKSNLLPVLVWGNGACTNSPWEHVNFLNEIASHGYLVVATGYIPENGERYMGPMSTSEQQIEGIDWVYAVNEDKESPYYHKIDVASIAISGMSCGGLQTLANAEEPRIKAMMICNSGLFIDPQTAIPGMPMPWKEDLEKIHTPIMYMLGGPEDIAYINGMDDFSRIHNVPAVAVNYPVGHGGTYAKPHGGEFAIVALSWLDWQLKGNEDSAGMFVGSPCGLDGREGWTCELNDKF